MIYAHYNKDTGDIIGFYDTDIHFEIPHPNIPISNDIRNDHVYGNLKKIKNGKIIEAGKPSDLIQSSEIIREEKIQAEIRAMAIERLQSRGEI